MLRIRSLLSTASLLAFTLVANIDAAHGGTIYSTGFESPTFTAGPLAPAPLAPGQDGWFYDDAGAGNTNIVGGTTAAGTTFDGTQALRVAADPLTNYVVRASPVTPTPAQPIVTMNFAMKIESASTPSVSWGAVVLDNGGVNTAELAAFRVRTDGTLDANDGNVGQAITAPGFVARDVWKSYSMVMNFNTFTWQLLVDGAPVTFGASGNTLELFISPSFAGGISEFDLVNRPGVLAANDSARFDAFSITQTAVPEPTTLAAVAMLGTLVARRRSN